jgi:hydrogenase maturation factor
LSTGKVPFDMLANLLRGIGDTDDVILGPALGEDAAILRTERSRILVASDPVTFVTDRIGWYAVHINANDVAAGGGEPRWFTAVLLLPENSTRRVLTRILRDMRLACSEVGAILVGGHTEVTSGVDRPLVIGTMMGEIAGSRPLRTGTARPGDRLVLTKGVAIEGTAILAREYPRECEAVLGERGLAMARRFLRRPGISILPEARVARALTGVHALHDLTEGGVVAGVIEMGQASGLGVQLELEAVPVIPPCDALCDHFGMDPLRLISSGALLIAVSPAEEDRLYGDLALVGVDAWPIGRMTMAQDMVGLANGQTTPLKPVKRDEIARFFDSSDNGS